MCPNFVFLMKIDFGQIDWDDAIVKHYVVIRTQNNNIFWCIGAFMWISKRLYVMSLRVELAIRQAYGFATYLAFVLVEELYLTS